MPEDIPHLLFAVADEQTVQSLRARMGRSRLAAEARFATSAVAAVTALQANPADYVFIDIRLDAHDALEMADLVAEAHPEMIRVLVADPRELASLRSSGVAHRYLSLPWDVEAIAEVVRRRYELEALLDDPGLRSVLERTERLPAAPSAYNRIAAEMRSPDASLQRVAAIVAQDPALTAKVLKHVNSAYFALRNEVTTIDKAVSLIGMNSVMAIVMAVGLYGGSSAAPRMVVESIRSQSLAVAGLTKAVARVEGITGPDRDTALLAGMLHDCGKLVLATNWPDEYYEVARGDDLALETQLFGADHALIGAHLLSTWKLADAVVEAVAHHHRPSAGHFDSLGAAALVHIGHALAHRPGNGTLPSIDMELMGEFELWDHTGDWIAAAEELEYEAANR